MSVDQDNPYKSPSTHDEAGKGTRRHNRAGTIGCALSTAGFLGLTAGDFLVSGWLADRWLVGVCTLLFLSGSGFLISLLALFKSPRRRAWFGVILGAFGLLYVPPLLWYVFLLSARG